MIYVRPETLGFGSKGNGITVWTNALEENNDYMTLAHIDANRVIHWRKELDEETIKIIESFAQTANPKISVTQDSPVFNTIV